MLFLNLSCLNVPCYIHHSAIYRLALQWDFLSRMNRRSQLSAVKLHISEILVMSAVKLGNAVEYILCIYYAVTTKVLTRCWHKSRELKKKKCLFSLYIKQSLPGITVNSLFPRNTQWNSYTCIVQHFVHRIKSDSSEKHQIYWSHGEKM